MIVVIACTIEALIFGVTYKEMSHYQVSISIIEKHIDKLQMQECVHTHLHHINKD